MWNVKGYFLLRSLPPPNPSPLGAPQTPIIYKADNKMLSKNTTRGARHGQPELNAARLRNAQQVIAPSSSGSRGKEEGRGSWLCSWRSSASPTSRTNWWYMKSYNSNRQAAVAVAVCSLLNDNHLNQTHIPLSLSLLSLFSCSSQLALFMTLQQVA